MKKLSILVFAGLMSCSLQNHIFADEDDFDFGSDDLSSLSLDNIKVDSSANQGMRSLGSSDAIYLFFSLVDGQPTYQNDLLNTPIYQQTSPIRNRPILEYPFTLTYAFDSKNHHSISLIPFLNYTQEKNFTKNSNTLGNYFLLGNPNRIEALNYIQSLLPSEFSFADSLAKSLALFDPATVQERRLGGVFESHIISNQWNLYLQLPILYAERNLYLTPVQKAAVASSSIGGVLETDGVSEDDFTYQHIVMDQVGLGDFKFKAMYEIHATPTFTIDLGGFVILPTATPFAQGIAGVWFDQNNDRAYLDLTTIDPTNITDADKDDIANFFLAAVDKLSSNILYCPLGNNGHVVIAPSINFDWYFADRWQFSNDFSLQVPLPSVEQRFFQYTQTPTQFLTDYNAAFAAGADDSQVFAQYVNFQVQNMFFPYVLPTMVYPGVVFNSTNQFELHLKTTDLALGANFWYQGAEQLKKPDYSNNTQNFSYNYVGAQAASAAQEKIFAKVNYNIETTKYFWSLSGYGDITIWNSGIGKDFTVALCVDCKF